jgi:hypothetical protein
MSVVQNFEISDDTLDDVPAGVIFPSGDFYSDEQPLETNRKCNVLNRRNKKAIAF